MKKLASAQVQQAVGPRLDLRVRRLALSDYTDDELEAELRNRRIERKAKKPTEWCDECLHFMVGSEETATTFNPCRKGKIMLFYMPEDYQDSGDGWGFYRRKCADRHAVSETPNVAGNRQAVGASG